MENTFLFDDIDEEEVEETKTIPQENTSYTFGDLYEDDAPVTSEEKTLPSNTTTDSSDSFLFDSDIDEVEVDFVEPEDEDTAFPDGIPTDDLVPSTMSDEEIDTRIDELYEEELEFMDIRDGKKEASTSAEWDRYYERLAQAQKEDELSGGQRALMLPKPQSAETTLQGLEKYRENKEAQKALLKERLKSKNIVTSGTTDALLNSGLNIGLINAIVSGQEVFDPATALAETPLHLKRVQEHIKNGEYGSATADGGWMILDGLAAIPGARLITDTISKGWKALGNGRDYNRVQDAMLNESALGEKIKSQNKLQAKANTEIKEDLIISFQDRNKVDISMRTKSGALTIDPTKVRNTGKVKLKEYYVNDLPVGNNADKVINPLDELAMVDDDVLAIPMLNPEKLDALVGVVADLKKEFPDLLKVPTVKITKGKRKGELRRAEPLVDQLFQLTVNKDLMPDDTLYKILNKHGMSYEEYMLGVVGSASQAGKFLNQVSQMSRFKPKGIKERESELANAAVQTGLAKFWSGTFLRGENIRRGLMVSSLATAARNLQSGIIRAPMESIGNIFDTALITYANAARQGDKVGGIVGATKNVMPFVLDGTYSNAFRNMKYMFADQQAAEQYTKYILDRPNLSKQLDRLNSNVMELQELTGRGQATTRVGQGLDKVVSHVEDGVAFLNTPNRWQEMMIRRTTFFSEVERLTNAEWGIDLRKTLDEGRIKDVLNDATDLRGTDGRSFVSIMDEASTKALDAAYAKQPDFPPFNYISNLITKTGLTVIVPFPRFMFNAIEYMAQNVGGVGIMAARKAMVPQTRGVMTPRDRQDITRNLVGIAAITGMYLYRTSDDAGERYESMEFEDQQVDLTATYPMRQIAWIAEYARRDEEGTLKTWYGLEKDHIAETWLGTSARTGVGNVIIDELRDVIADTDDIIDKNKRFKAIGSSVGQYVNTFLTPLFQGVELQRASDIRSDVYVDAAREPTLNDNWVTSFGSGFSRSMIQRGMAAPSFEEDMPNRVSINTGDIKRYDPLKKTFLGLNIKEADSDLTEYLLEIGYEDPTYEFGSRSKIPSEKRAENKYLSVVLPIAVNIGREQSEIVGGSKSDKHTTARKRIKEIMDNARQEFLTDGYASPYASAVDDLSRVPRDDRQYGIMMFKKFNDGRSPDPRSLEDLLMLIELSDDVM